MTLTDFLLARIAEDEAPTYELVPYGCGAWCCAPPGWVGHRCLICDTAAEFGGTVEAITEISREHEEDVHRRSRTLAECEAKRAIVAAHPYSEGGDHCCASSDPYGEEMYYAWDVCPTLAAVATIYANHPDYRDDWKP